MRMSPLPAGLAASGLILAALLLSGCQAPPQPVEPTTEVLLIPDYEEFVDRTLTTLRRYDLPPERVDRSRGVIVTRPTTSGQWFELWRRDAQGRYNRLESSLHTISRRVTVRLEPVTTAAAQVPPMLGMLTPPAAADDHPGDFDRLRESPSTLILEPRSIGEPSRAATPAPAPLPSPAPGSAAQPARADADLGWGPPPLMPSAGPFRVTVLVEKSRYSAPERQITTASGALAIYSERIPTTEGLRRAASRGDHWVPLGRDGLLEAYLLGRIIDAAEVDVLDAAAAK